MSIAILCDFDDTVAVENVAQLLLDRFSPVDWRPILKGFQEGTIRPRDYFELPFRPVRASKEEMQAYVREKAHLRPGFKELAAYCRHHGVELAVLTYGLDFYVDALLEREGLDWLPRYTVGAVFTGHGIDFQYKYTRECCTQWGNCKCLVLERYKAQGHKVFYVGDGRSDFCPARRADLVFARSHLLEVCQQEGLLHRELRDFYDVIGELAQKKGDF